MSADREKQIAEAEEVLGDRLDKTSLVKGLFFGRVPRGPLTYPDLAPAVPVAEKVEELRRFCHGHIDAAAIDRAAEIPSSVISGLGKLGVLGACVPQAYGGLGYGQVDYCRLVEVLGGHCGSTALFVNAHHSIGPRALVLFGNEAQKTTYLPRLATGEWLSAFALTEPEAGSDAANVQTRATPTADGRGYLINGQKRWITNGGIAQVLTLMARTPVPHSKETKITAFVVTPDMPGFRVVDPRMSKCGVRGTATGELAFHEMFVPKENVLGELGRGLRVALTVLDYGRTTFGASCTGAAKQCLKQAAAHARTRVQFGQTLGSFELVKEKLAYMSALSFAMDAMTYQTAALIDAGAEDYMLETALLKVFSTDALWRIVNDTIQIYGGKAYFTDEPYERMMRDARINMIGEGANDVLRVFTALGGMRDVGLDLKGVLDALQSPLGNWSKLGGFARRKMTSLVATPAPQTRHADLQEDAQSVGRSIGAVASAVERLLAKYREGIMDRQLQLARISDVMAEIYAGCCVLSRLDRALGERTLTPVALERQLAQGRYFLKTSARRVRQTLAQLWDNDDDATIAAGDAALLPELTLAEMFQEPAAEPDPHGHAHGHDGHGHDAHGH